MDRISSLVNDVETARRYTNTILNAVDPADWFRQPTEGLTHVAWQVGHLAVAQYRLALFLIRGHRPEDERLISEEFMKHFQPGSVPDPVPHHNPPVEEIRDVFDRVHAQTITETQKRSADGLQDSSE